MINNKKKTTTEYTLIALLVVFTDDEDDISGFSRMNLRPEASSCLIVKRRDTNICYVFIHCH